MTEFRIRRKNEAEKNKAKDTKDKTEMDKLRSAYNSRNNKRIRRNYISLPRKSLRQRDFRNVNAARANNTRFSCSFIFSHNIEYTDISVRF